MQWRTQAESVGTNSLNSQTVVLSDRNIHECPWLVAYIYHNACASIRKLLNQRFVANSLLYLFFTFKPENICRAPICALHRVEQWRKLGAKRIGTLVHYCSQRDPAFKMKLAPISISLFITFAHTFTFLLFMLENRGICSKRPLKKELTPMSLSLYTLYNLYFFFCRCFFFILFWQINWESRDNENWNIAMHWQHCNMLSPHIISQ